MSGHRVEKHLSQRGEGNHKSKLTTAQVLEILASSEPSPALGRKYGVNQSTIRKIRSGSRWRWL